jgi:small neutral amino acid transporter SnatA (MarC family)
VSFGFLVAGFLATTNAGRVALAASELRPRRRDVAIALGAGLVLAAVAIAVAGDLLDALSISPESFRIAAGIVLAATGLRDIVWPTAEPSGPFGAALVTPDLAAVAISFGADEPTGKALGAAAIAFVVVAGALAVRRRDALVRGAQFLAAVEIVVATALVVSGIRDV